MADDHHGARRLQLGSGFAGRVVALSHPLHVRARPRRSTTSTSTTSTRAGSSTAPIVDPRERGGIRAGKRSLAQRAPDDGRWAYTLYDEAQFGPRFVHALDTSSRTARCIDLDALAKTDLTHLGLRLDTRHGLLMVTRGDRPALKVDLASFQVRRPSTASSDFPWLLGTLLVVGVLVLAALRSLNSTRPQR